MLELAEGWLGVGGLGVGGLGVGGLDIWGLGVGVAWVSSRRRGLSRAMALYVAKSAVTHKSYHLEPLLKDSLIQLRCTYVSLTRHERAAKPYRRLFEN
jgi:hypothetical protein